MQACRRQRVLRVNTQAGVAHQQVAAVARPQPPSCPIEVAVLVAPEIVHTQQVRVLAEALRLCLPR